MKQLFSIIVCFLIINIQVIAQTNSTTTKPATTKKTTATKPSTTNKKPSTTTKSSTTVKKPANTTTKPANTTSTKSTATSTAKPSSTSKVVFSKEDSLEVIRQLLEDLSFMYEPGTTKPFSYGTVRAGIGNSYFTPKSTSLNSTSGKIYYLASGNYFHKTGLGLTVTGLAVPEKGSLNFFQTYVSPSYDYTRSKAIGFGAAYTHYFVKDSLSFETSPLVNEFYGYVSYKKNKYRPTLGINYATGRVEEKFQAVRNGPVATAVTDLRDITLLGSVNRYFTWKRIIGLKDRFVFSPTLMAIAGTLHYGTNLSVTSIGRTTNHYNTNNKNKKKSNNQSQTTAPPTTTTEQYKGSTNFQMQSLSLILSSDYSIGKFSFQPQVLLDYSIPSTDKKLYALFNATIGVSL